MSERGNGILHFLDYWAGIPLCLLTALYRKLHHPLIPEKVERIAILCQGAIGDLLLLSALVQALHDKFPRVKIDLLLSRANYQAADLIPHIHSALIFSVRKPLNLVLYLRNIKYDLLIDASPWARLGAIISNCSNAKFTIGFKSHGQMRHFGFDKSIFHSDKIHEKDNFLALGKSIWKDLRGECKLVIRERKEIEKELGDEKYICFHMWPAGIKSHLKEWPDESWHRLCERLIQAGYRILLTGGAADTEKTENFIERYFKDNINIFSIAGKYDLREMASVLCKACALISVNTGIMHLGALANIPTVGLHGPTNPLRWGPLGMRSISLLPKVGRCAYLDFGFEYPRGAKNTMGLISVDDVLDALEKLGIKI